MLTLEVFLSLRDDQPSDALDGPLAELAQRILIGWPEAGRLQTAFSLKHHRDGAARAGDPLARLDDFVASGLAPSHTAVPIASFDAVMELSVPEGTDPNLLIEAVDGLVDTLGPSVDASRSGAVLGADHLITDGTGPVQLLCCLQRMPALSLEEFSHAWLHDLVEHTTKTPGKSGYRQLHADRRLTIQAARAAGVGIEDIDGVALESYPDVAALWAASDWADQPGAPIAEAEHQLIDFSRARAILTYTPAGS